MRYFDLHCDTVNKCLQNNCDVYNASLQVKVKSSRNFENYTQCFALWLDDSTDASEAFFKADKMYRKYIEVNKCVSSYQNFNAYLTLENAAFGEKNEYIELWKQRGVIMASLSWNGKNELAHGALCKYGGLSERGRDAIRKMENCGMVLDVSHLNEKSFYDVCKTARKPFVASHSNCYEVCANKRNLKDFQLKEIFLKGGLVGLCFYPKFLGGGDVFENIYKNISHLLSLGGENAIALGSDFDGAEMDERLNSSEKVVDLYEFLLKKGLGKVLLEKIFFRNCENFFNNVLQVQ